ncbi:hypothetical protein EJ06DRAFT_530524, partial [Trichodelitschia bisporula]
MAPAKRIPTRDRFHASSVFHDPHLLLVRPPHLPHASNVSQTSTLPLALQRTTNRKSTRRLRHEDYTIGWICALDIELAAPRKMLDEEHQPLCQGD